MKMQGFGGGGDFYWTNCVDMPVPENMSNFLFRQFGIPFNSAWYLGGRQCISLP